MVNALPDSEGQLTRSRVIRLLQAAVFCLGLFLPGHGAASDSGDFSMVKVSRTVVPERVLPEGRTGRMVVAAGMLPAGSGQGGGASAEAAISSGEQLLRQGMDLYSAERFTEAAAILSRARAALPRSSSVAFFQGLAEKQMENYGAAAGYFRDAVTFEPKIKEALIELIEVLHHSSSPADKEESWRWLAVAEEEKILPGKTAFLKGLMFQDSSEYERAVSSFENAKKLDPSLSQAADLQIALCYARERKVDLANERLKAVILQDPQSDLAAYARQYQEVVGREARDASPWRFTLGVFGQCDSNLLSKPDEPERYYSTDPEMVANNPESVTVSPTFRVDFVPAFKGPFLFNAQYSASGSWNTRWSTSHDTVAQSASISPGVSFGTFSLSMVSSYNYSLLRGPSLKSYTGQAKFGPLFRMVVGERSLVELFGGYSSTEFFPDAASVMEDRDADAQHGYLSWIWLYREDGFLNLKYEYANSNAAGAWWSNDAHAVSLNLTVPLAGSFVLQFSGSATSQNYSNPVTDFDFVAATATDKKRRDMVFFGSAGFAWEFVRNTKLVVQYAVVHASSTIGRYEYQRRIGTAGVEFRF